MISDPQLYCRWKTGTTPSLETLDLICTKHVDDLKGSSTRKDAESLKAHLESIVGDCKWQEGKFLHTGIEHEYTKELLRLMPKIESIYN